MSEAETGFELRGAALSALQPAAHGADSGHPSDDVLEGPRNWSDIELQEAVLSALEGGEPALPRPRSERRAAIPSTSSRDQDLPAHHSNMAAAREAELARWVAYRERGWVKPFHALPPPPSERRMIDDEAVPDLLAAKADLTLGVPDAFMRAMCDDARYRRHRRGGQLGRNVNARELWGDIVQARCAGAPVGLVFTDRPTPHRHPDWLLDLSRFAEWDRDATFRADLGRQDGVVIGLVGGDRLLGDGPEASADLVGLYRRLFRRLSAVAGGPSFCDVEASLPRDVPLPVWMVLMEERQQQIGVQGPLALPILDGRDPQQAFLLHEWAWRFGAGGVVAPVQSVQRPVQPPARQRGRNGLPLARLFGKTG